MKWIACEKELPMMGMPVLAICADGSPEAITHTVYRTNGVNDWQWNELFNDNNYDEGMAIFSHWMPMPPPPTNQGE